jgi:hypothetical protein
MTQFRIPIQKATEPKQGNPMAMKRRTRLYLMDGSKLDTPLTMYQMESFVQSAGRVQTTPFLRTVVIDDSGKTRSTLISYGFLARVVDLESYQ